MRFDNQNKEHYNWSKIDLTSLDEHQRFMLHTFIIGSNSHSVSKGVGALIVKDRRIISTGYNGSPSGYINCDEYVGTNRERHEEFKDKFDIHAEMNALLFAAKNGLSVNGASLYCNYIPCTNCTKHIIQAGIKEVYYFDEYKEEKDHVLKFFKDMNVKVTKINLKEKK